MKRIKANLSFKFQVVEAMGVAVMVEGEEDMEEPLEGVQPQ